MSLPAIAATAIPISEQHSFLDLAKAFEWESVKDLVKSNPSLVHVQPCGRGGGKRWSALHQAAYSGNSDAVRFLVNCGAPLDLETDDGKWPIHVAKDTHIRALLRSFSTDGTSLRLGTATIVLKSVIGKAMKKSKVMKKKKVAKTATKKKTKVAKGKRAKRLVFKGKFEKTGGGLHKSHLVKSKTGKIVSKRMQDHGKRSYSRIKSWVEAFMKARADLGLTGFVALKKGSPLYIKTMEIYSS